MDMEPHDGEKISSERTGTSSDVLSTSPDGGVGGRWIREPAFTPFFVSVLAPYLATVIRPSLCLRSRLS